MKPLSDIETFLDRFDNFKDGEFRDIQIISASVIRLTLAAQDKAREFDWVSVSLEFSRVSDARVLENKKLSLIDMGDGINIIKEDGHLAFGVGKCYNLSTIKSSSCYILSSSMKYEEGSF